jgi:hypothetical protein
METTQRKCCNGSKNWTSVVYSNVYYEAKSVLHWAEVCLEKNTFPREDYRELLELTVV